MKTVTHLEANKHNQYETISYNYAGKLTVNE